ncbi:L-type lectin-domain containing receptor kinase IV.4 [Cardamine amara subsp. amara]|uniref:non-specific serine/threonine protein kinase n=1 Tax=Cardamine amara subsp. amara TaxID=228776 RepID=A0ABD1C6N5_CARAN
MFFKLLTIFFFFLSFFWQSLKSSSQILDFTYNGFRDTQASISTQGIATVKPNGILKLTNFTRLKTGHAFCTKPIRFKDSPNGTVSSFSTTFVFAIHSEILMLSSNGMAFVISPNTSFPFSGPSQYLGLFNITNDGDNTNHVFAVELDTIMNAEFNDINTNHVGIDINSMKSVKSSPAGYWDEKDQFKNLTLFNLTRMQVWVDYDGLTHRIDVTLAPLRNGKPRKPLVSIVRDLSSVLLQDMFLGFSSATGNILTEHYVLGWSFRVKGEASPLDLSKLPKLPRMRPTGVRVFYEKRMPLIALLFIILFVFLVRFIVRRRRKFAEEIEDWETEFKKNRLRFKDLYYATKGFKDKNLLGSGGFGKVYRGIMPITEKEIAVKRVSNESRQGLKEFVAEIVSIGQMSHRNIVPLIGYCRRRDELLLVYDYMPNGSLDKYLYDSPKVTLDWKQRFKVIKDVASGLFYLHEEWEQVVIHRDVKASNVLLDAELNGRLGDFGLSQLCNHGSNPKTTHIVGTWGYLAPDHWRTGRPTTGTDVFAFGVLLLEVACGRHPIEVHKNSGERVLLADWVYGFWVDGNILNAKDPNLGSEYDQKEVEMVLKLGLLCSHSDPQVRPTMRQVLHYLRGDAMLPDLSPLDLRGRESVSGKYHGFSESSTFTTGSSIAHSILSSGR